jgi:amidase
MSFAEYSSFDGLGLAALVRERQISSRELVDECLLRIERVNPRINAVVRVLAEQARASAVAGLPTGPFAGVPFLLKDLTSAYAGAPLARGSRAFRDFVPTVDTELVRRHKAAGLVIVGKTNTPEFGLQPVCEPELFGPTHTPWKLGHTSGGSSGGSGAAVAAGLVPMAHGDDGGGSLRIPASCCGVFALKPSRGRMPCGPGASEHWWGCAAEHAITRSVRDNAALLDATCGVGPGDAYHLPPPTRPFLSEVGTPPGPLRVLLIKQPIMPGKLHGDCEAAVVNTGKRLLDLGHQVEEGKLDIEPFDFARDFFLLVCVAMAGDIDSGHRLLGRKISSSEVETSTWLASLLGRQAAATSFTQARARLFTIGRKMASLFERYDIVLTPTLAQPPRPIGELSPKGIERGLHKTIAALNLGFLLRLPGVVKATVNKAFAFAPFTAVANVSGLPAMNVPLEWSPEGLPIGSHFMAKLGDEATLFRLAAQLEAVHPWAQRRPPIHSDAVA